MVFQCLSCNKSYRHQRSLIGHQRFECGKEPSFACPVESCSYKGRRKSHLKGHISNIHMKNVEETEQKKIVLELMKKCT